MLFEIDQHIDIAVFSLVASCKRAENPQFLDPEILNGCSIAFQKIQNFTFVYHEKNVISNLLKCNMLALFVLADSTEFHNGNNLPSHTLVDKVQNPLLYGNSLGL